MTDEFEAVHARLKGILSPYATDGLVVSKDGPGGMALEIAGLEGKPWGYVAGTRLGKRYVSFYLMPLYENPALAQTISPDLARRRQGKGCLNFTKVDEPLFAELTELTARSIPGYRERAAAAAARR